MFEGSFSGIMQNLGGGRDGEEQGDLGQAGLCVGGSGCVQTLASHQACLTQP